MQALVVVYACRRWLPDPLSRRLLGLFTVGSVGLWLLTVQRHPSASYFLFPTRFWEIALGMWIAGRLPLAPWLTGKAVRFGSATLLFCLPWLPREALPPAVAIAVVATATALLCATSGRRAAPSSGNLVGYALAVYVLHWPLLALSHQVWISTPPWYWRLGAVGLALALAVPVARAWPSSAHRYATMVLALSLTCVVAGAGSIVIAGRQHAALSASFAGVVAPETRACHWDLQGPLDERCAAGRPRFLLWGDSFARHLVPGLEASSPHAFVAVYRPLCGPVAGLAPLRFSLGFTSQWAETCLAHNERVLAYASSAEAPHHVLLASPFRQYLADTDVLVSTTADNPRLTEREGGLDLAMLHFSRTVRRLQQAGKHVVIVAPPPRDDHDIGRCLRREAIGLPNLRLGRKGCSIDRQRYEQRRREVFRFLEALQASTSAKVIRFEPLLCTIDTCAVKWQGIPLYSDDSHLSPEGAAALGVSAAWATAWLEE